MIILTHTTALHALRHLGAEVVSTLPRRSIDSLGARFENPLRAAERYSLYCLSAGMTPAALHLLYPRGKHPANTEFAHAHEASDLPPFSLIELAEDIYAACPELIFCQLVSWGNTYDAILLAYELCGTYAHPDNMHLPLKTRSAFSTKERLASFISQRSRFRGKATAKIALSYVHERSASPMETAFATLLGLPYKLGGLNFPHFEMNWEITIPKHLRADIGRTKLTVDLCWVDRKVAFEYDSMEHHGTVEQAARDASKRNALMLLNYRVVSFAGGQLRDKGEVMRAVNALAKELGHRINPRSKEHKSKRRQLEWTVFRDGASIFAARPNARSKDLHPPREIPSSLK